MLQQHWPWVLGAVIWLVMTFLLFMSDVDDAGQCLFWPLWLLRLIFLGVVWCGQGLGQPSLWKWLLSVPKWLGYQTVRPFLPSRKQNKKGLQEVTRIYVTDHDDV